MLTKKVLIGALASFFCLGLVSPGFTGGYGKVNPSPGDKVTMQSTDYGQIEFDYSPREEGNNVTVYSPADSAGENIEFDYSPRRDQKSVATLPAANSGSEDIQFDYSPRPTNCSGAYC